MKKNSQSCVVGFQPLARLTIASCGTSWRIVPTGYTPPLGEFATRSASGRCPRRLSTRKPRTFVIVLRFRKSAGFMSRSSGGAVDDGRGATACSVPPPPPPPHAPTPAATTTAIAMLAAHTLTPCLRSLLMVFLHGPQTVVGRGPQQGRLPPVSCRQRCSAKRRASAASRKDLLRARRTSGGTGLVVAGTVVVTRAGVVVVVVVAALALPVATAALNHPATCAFDASFFFPAHPISPGTRAISSSTPAIRRTAPR